MRGKVWLPRELGKQEGGDGRQAAQKSGLSHFKSCLEEGKA